MRYLLLLSLLLVLLLAQVAESKKMWGSRKRRDDDEDMPKPPAQPKKTYEAPAQRKPAVKSTGVGMGGMGDLMGGGLAQMAGGAGMEEMMLTYLNMFEEMLDSEDFDSMVNPEAIRAMMDQFPGASDNPEIVALLDSPQFNDPALLRQTMKDGIRMIRASAGEIIAMLSDPEKIAALLEQLPPEAQALIQGLQSGDMSGIKDLINNFPGENPTTTSYLLPPTSYLLSPTSYLLPTTFFSYSSSSV
ncbi:hypothetical protein B484DRAFT_218554 [Ochromonadaceae sp. CCMP2298]|nr:hypothetical protein B484DRAFT_218554 [Ochromonadaceae sp. CCMP2298]